MSIVENEKNKGLEKLKITNYNEVYSAGEVFCCLFDTNDFL